MRKITVTIPTSIADVKSAAVKGKDAAKKANNDLKKKAVIALLNNEHTHDEMAALLTKTKAKVEAKKTS